MKPTTVHPFRYAPGRMLLLGALTVLVGCASTKPPDYVAPDFDPGLVDEVVVLSVVDHRIDRSKELQLDDWLLPMTEKALRKKKYTCTVHPGASLTASVTRVALDAPTPEFITALQPESAKWVLLLVLHDARSKITFGSTGNAELSGYLFDRERGTLVWRNKETAKVGQGGLLGMAFKGTMQKSAITQATRELLGTFPARSG